ncbi:MAG: hypothetical protein FD170_3268 [Bacteroidetes bacterium]|nr:MAG: hypothetical protein FD170_3268 [Bacteroidota bacterium]
MLALNQKQQHQQACMKLIHFIKIIILLTSILFIFSLWQRQPDIDDAWIGEHAYWMADKGYVKSELMHGITNQHIRHIVHHKLFTLAGALFISIFGFSLFTLKSVSLFSLIVFLIIFYRYLKKRVNDQTLWIGMLLISVNAFIFQYSFVFRPEIMVMTLGFVSFIFLERGVNETFKLKWVLLGGLFAGLAAATHLNGLIFIASGGLLLFFKRKPKLAVLFGLAAIPGFAVYFYDFSREFGFDYWLYQIKDAPALHTIRDLPESLSLLERPFREQRRFFHSPKEISFSVLFIFLMIAGRKEIRKNSLPLMYLLFLVISLAAVSVHSTSKYLMLYMPVMVVLMSRAFSFVAIESTSDNNFFRLKTSSLAKWAVGLTMLYIGIQMYWNVNTSINKYDTNANRRFSETYFGKDTEELNILAPMNFIFNEIDHFNRIQSDLGYIDIQKTGLPLHGSFMLRYADSSALDYLIITKEYRSRFGMDTLTESQRNLEGFITIEKNNEFEILKNDR